METVRSKGSLQNLIPIAVVVTGGCEPCAEKMVKRALGNGSSWNDVDEAVRIVADMQKMDCVQTSLGPEVVARMQKPLAAARRTLDAAAPQENNAKTPCGCTAGC